MSLARLACAAAVSLFLVLGAPAALASYGVATGAGAPELHVNASGVAEVSWTAGGARKSFLVPRSGAGHYGSLAGKDVSKPTSLALPLAVTVRETPDHTLWALQRVAIAGRPTSLDLARWQGPATKLTLVDDGTHLTGGATFHGRPVAGYSSTLTGKRARIYVYLECFGCPGARNAWTLMLGVPPKADGSFAVALRPSWRGKRYRATVFGPNVGGELAPDARVTLDAA
ncbi:MAG TPA: hypothetical protein VFA97_10460 [Gaiellaceae bacterium]|nr:hypothetical protein [Gaiellaceae bacterium]